MPEPLSVPRDQEANINSRPSSALHGFHPEELCFSGSLSCSQHHHSANDRTKIAFLQGLQQGCVTWLCSACCMNPRLALEQGLHKLLQSS